MNNKRRTNRKHLILRTETLVNLDTTLLDGVRGGLDGAARQGPTAADHSCNVACGPAR